MSAWALIVFVLVVAGATLWATPRSPTSPRRPRQGSRPASLEVGPPLDTLRFTPRPRRSVEREDRSGDA